MAAIDVKRLAAEVSVQHGIRLDPDDPIMAVVTLNQLVFEQSVSVVVDRVASAVRAPVSFSRKKSEIAWQAFARKC
jgi:hypothetical protein